MTDVTLLQRIVLVLPICALILGVFLVEVILVQLGRRLHTTRVSSR